MTAYGFTFLWGVRRRSVERSTQDLIRFTSTLAEVASAYRKWSDALSDKPAMTIRLPSETIRQMLLRGRNWTDIPRVLIPNLGFSCSLHSPQLACLDVHVGVYTKWVYNTLYLKPVGALQSEKGGSLRSALTIATMIVEHWQPDHGVFDSNDLAEALDCDDFESGSGWVTYLGPRYAGFAGIPTQMSVVPAAGGRFITVPPATFKSHGEEARKLLKRLSASIKKWRAATGMFIRGDESTAGE